MQDIKIKAVMSIPRVGWNDSWGCVHEALSPFGIPVARFNGVFWGQCMQRAMQEALDQGCDWLLTIDYDSMFTKWDLDRMIGHFGENPEIDALAPLQMRRGKELPLVTKQGATDFEVSPQPIQVSTAHFGLTLLRMEALKAVPKPWFVSKPSESGEWDDSRLDDDIWFWHRWAEAGKTCYLAPDVSIGHLEVMVSQFGPDGKPEHIYVGDWRKHQETRQAV